MSDVDKLAFTLAYYSGDRKTGSVAIVDGQAGKIEVIQVKTLGESGSEAGLKPIFIGITPDHNMVTLDPKHKTIAHNSRFVSDAFPAHIYSDPTSDRAWFMNDGDKESGNDTLNCGDQGSSVTVIEQPNSAEARYLKTICVGRGHHQASFTYPAPTAPSVPHTVYISNLKDGTLSAIGNDPARAEDYLKVVATINLCEADKEEGMCEPTVPNNAFPHGLAYSPLSGKVYNLNNGYGTIAVVDPLTYTIEERIPFKGHSNLFLSPCGRYIIGRGADRKSDPHHVIAKLSVFDVVSKRIVAKLDIPDIYISKYYFNPEGTKLYLTTSSSGSPEQLAHLKTDALLIFDLMQLPELKLRQELRLGSSPGSLEFLTCAGKTERLFSANAQTGSLMVLDGESDQVIDEIKVAV
ncbi:MAG: hypothetical protein FD130_1166, partial [Halothiobacillaceae bacterium]